MKSYQSIEHRGVLYEIGLGPYLYELHVDGAIVEAHHSPAHLLEHAIKLMGAFSSKDDDRGCSVVFPCLRPAYYVDAQGFFSCALHCPVS